jgi:hypothetical protein
MGKLITPREDWKWFGHAAHFICSRWCQFHLSTQVGKWLVSTVGEYWPERAVREIHAEVHNPAWLAKNRYLKGDTFDAAYMKEFGFEDIGSWGKYETMVFEIGGLCKEPDCNCGLPRPSSWSELEGIRYETAGEATKGHYKYCEKWAQLDAVPQEVKQ